MIAWRPDGSRRDLPGDLQDFQSSRSTENPGVMSRNEKAVAVILGNPAMIDAYRAGIPGNAKPVPDGARDLRTAVDGDMPCSISEDENDSLHRPANCYRCAITVFNVKVWLVVELERISMCATTSIPAFTGIDVGFPKRGLPKSSPPKVSTSRSGCPPP
jgi:hypothetical protein